MNATNTNPANMNPGRQRLPVLVAFVLFLLLCASLAYWLLQWLAPPPRPVAAPVDTERAMPPVAAAANLFGGAARGGDMMNVQLRGILHAGSAAGSVAIMSVNGSAPKFYRVQAELIPGVTVKAIHARSVVLSDRGAERELPLPAFASQEGGATSAPLRAMPEQNLPPQPPQPPSPPTQPSQSPQQLQQQAQPLSQPQPQSQP